MCNRPFDVVVCSLVGITEDQLNKLKGMAAEQKTTEFALIGKAVDSLLSARPLKEDEVRKVKERLEEIEGAALTLLDIAAEATSEL